MLGAVVVTVQRLAVLFPTIWRGRFERNFARITAMASTYVCAAMLRCVYFAIADIGFGFSSTFTQAHGMKARQHSISTHTSRE